MIGCGRCCGNTIGWRGPESLPESTLTLRQGLWGAIATREKDAPLLAFDEGRSGSTERVEDRVGSADAEALQVVPDQMRREGEDEAVPIVDGTVVGTHPVGVRGSCGCYRSHLLLTGAATNSSGLDLSPSGHTRTGGRDVVADGMMAECWVGDKDRCPRSDGYSIRRQVRIRRIPVAAHQPGPGSNAPGQRP